jgi:prepilin-type N-terminal cleavage/methylation domain-containing protein
MRHQSSLGSNSRGFTLAEMLVVCAITGLVMAGLLGLVMSGQQAYWFGTTQVDAQQTTRVAIERMVKDIREAGYYPQGPDTTPANCPSVSNYPLYPAGPPCYVFVPVTSQTATALTLQYDWNGNRVIASTMVNDPFLCPTGSGCRGEQVTYSFSAGNLTRQEIGVDATPLVIASGIAALTFTYLDDNQNITTSRDRIRTVGISITAQTAARGAYVTMIDRIRLRNR